MLLFYFRLLSPKMSLQLWAAWPKTTTTTTTTAAATTKSSNLSIWMTMTSSHPFRKPNPPKPGPQFQTGTSSSKSRDHQSLLQRPPPQQLRQVRWPRRRLHLCLIRSPWLRQMAWNSSCFWVLQCRDSCPDWLSGMVLVPGLSSGALRFDSLINLYSFNAPFWRPIIFVYFENIDHFRCLSVFL